MQARRCCVECVGVRCVRAWVLDACVSSACLQGVVALGACVFDACVWSAAASYPYLGQDALRVGSDKPSDHNLIVVACQVQALAALICEKDYLQHAYISAFYKNAIVNS